MHSHFKNVLFIGPDYVDARGGMGSVLGVYAASVDTFNFMCSYPEKSAVENVLFFGKVTSRFIWRLLRDRQIKIIHLHTAARGSFFRKSFLALIGKAFRKKVILHFHSGSFRDYYSAASPGLRTYIRFVIRKCDRIISISDRADRFFKEISSKNNVIRVDNPVLIGAKPEHVSSHLPLRLLFLSRLNANKGAFDLLELVHREQDFFRGKILFQMAGDGEVEQFKSLVQQYGVGDIVQYKGWVSGQEKDTLMTRCDALILPSYYEELPMTILEAMAFAKPVVATDVGGIPNVIKEQVNGWLFQPGDMKRLLCILKEMLENPQKLCKYGANSYEIVGKYSTPAVLEKLESIYISLLQN